MLPSLLLILGSVCTGRTWQIWTEMPVVVNSTNILRFALTRSLPHRLNHKSRYWDHPSKSLSFYGGFIILVVTRSDALSAGDKASSTQLMRSLWRSSEKLILDVVPDVRKRCCKRKKRTHDPQKMSMYKRLEEVTPTSAVFFPRASQLQYELDLVWFWLKSKLKAMKGCFVFCVLGKSNFK